ncbi:MAG: hypothetical protein KIT22_12955 [Verrucomicrobiae bacterium]|nr:hypothetical protein [Verrucomicrobiae bacterium]
MNTRYLLNSSSAPVCHPVTRRLPRSLGALGTALALAAGAVAVQAQSDNFDADTLGAQWTKYQFIPQSYTFVPSEGGQALRIQANPIPNTAPAAAAISQSTVYTDFYVSVDLVNWQINDQALVLLAQWTPGGGDGLSEGSGIIMNYDVAQDGEKDSDRKGGQIQINTVFPGFVTATKAAGDLTLEPGHSYRMVFQGMGTTYTARVYDTQDLTAPLVTLQVEDSTYSSGLSGFLSFSRAGTTGVTDVTIDNYFAAATDPNADLAPLLPPPVSGTPTVVSRTPASRFTNFHPVADGIRFEARTFSTAQIDAAATKLLLNGTDVSASLAPLPPNGTSATFTTAAGTLASNTVYAARIELQDTTGTLRSTHTFWFDTFTDAFVGALPARTIEVEDYNYSDGLFQTGVIPVSGLDENGAQVGGGGGAAGYYATVGTPEVDYFKPGGSYHSELSEYRPEDRVQITQGSTFTGVRDEAGDILDDLTLSTDPYRIHDTQRSQYRAAKVWEYQVRLTSPGDWMNYTREIAEGDYQVYLRCGSFGSTSVHLDKVTSDPKQPNQTTERLGTFDISNHLMRLNYRYEPLLVDGRPAAIHLSGTTTLRLTLAGTALKDDRTVSLDYLLLIPATESSDDTVFDDFNDGNDTANPAWEHYDPIGGLTASPATFTFPDGHYRIIAPAQQDPDCGAGPARAGTFIKDRLYSDFEVSADLIDFDDTVRQAFGLAARIVNPGLGTTGGYLASWEPGGGALPGENNGDLDISILVNEAAVGQIETAPSGLHLEKGKSYRFVFRGSGNNFEFRVYDLANLDVPLIVLPGTDPDNTYTSGLVGLITASNGDCAVGADATWDNFLAKLPEPRLAIQLDGSTASLSWPAVPSTLESSPSLTAPAWTAITSGITEADGQKHHSTQADGTLYYRLVFP